MCNKIERITGKLGEKAKVGNTTLKKGKIQDIRKFFEEGKWEKDKLRPKIGKIDQMRGRDFEAVKYNLENNTAARGQTCQHKTDTPNQIQ